MSVEPTRGPGRRIVLAAAATSVWMMPVVKASADSPALTASQQIGPANGGGNRPADSGGAVVTDLDPRLLRWFNLTAWSPAPGRIDGNFTVGVVDPGQQALVSVSLELRDAAGSLLVTLPQEPVAAGEPFRNRVAPQWGIQLTFQFPDLAQGEYTVRGLLSGAVTTRRLPNSGDLEQGFWAQDQIVNTTTVRVGS